MKARIFKAGIFRTSLLAVLSAATVASLALPGTALASPGTASAAAQRGGGDEYGPVWLETPRRLCLWPKALKNGSQIVEVPCRKAYAWDEFLFPQGRVFFPGNSRSVALGDLSGRIRLVPGSDLRSDAFHEAGWFKAGTWIWSYYRAAHAPAYLYTHGRGHIVTAVRAPNHPWSALRTPSPGGRL